MYVCTREITTGPNKHTSMNEWMLFEEIVPAAVATTETSTKRFDKRLWDTKYVDNVALQYPFERNWVSVSPSLSQTLTLCVIHRNFKINSVATTLNVRF